MAEYKVNQEDKDITWFIDTVLVRDIGTTIGAGAGYLAFSLMAQGIELLGAFMDEQEFNDTGLSEDRFKKAIKEFFPSKYAAYNNPSSDFFLFRDLRCGMAHVLRPQGRLAFVGKADAKTMWLTHLQEVDYDGRVMLILVLEDFYSDFCEACRKAKNKIKQKGHAKLKRGYLSLYAHSSRESMAAPTLSASPEPPISLAPILKPKGPFTTGTANLPSDPGSSLD